MADGLMNRRHARELAFRGLLYVAVNERTDRREVALDGNYYAVLLVDRLLCLVLVVEGIRDYYPYGVLVPCEGYVSERLGAAVTSFARVNCSDAAEVGREEC